MITCVVYIFFHTVITEHSMLIYCGTSLIIWTNTGMVPMVDVVDSNKIDHQALIHTNVFYIIL